jgi:hypothetical protein
MNANGDREWTRIQSEPRMDAKENLTQSRKGAKVKTTTADGPSGARQPPDYGGQSADLCGWGSLRGAVITRDRRRFFAGTPFLARLQR